MCRWIAYSGKRIFLSNLVLAPRNSLIEQSLNCQEGKLATNGDGFGIGWYDGRDEPGLYREILPAWNDENLQHIARHIRSPLFFAHVRASTGSATIRQNCHPFAWKNWMFMHNGQIGGYNQLRRKLENMLSDEMFMLRTGSSDSEILFLLMVQNGLEEDPVAAIRKTTDQVQALMDAEGVTESFKQTICLSDGKCLYAVRHASCGKPPTLYWRKGSASVQVASEPLDDIEERQWQEVRRDSLIAVCEELEVTFHPL